MTSDSNMRAVAVWLHEELGFPTDWSTTPPPPTLLAELVRYLYDDPGNVVHGGRFTERGVISWLSDETGWPEQTFVDALTLCPEDGETDEVLERLQDEDGRYREHVMKMVTTYERRLERFRVALIDSFLLFDDLEALDSLPPEWRRRAAEQSQRIRDALPSERSGKKFETAAEWMADYLHGLGVDPQ